jgi:hypothetical protein
MTECAGNDSNVCRGWSLYRHALLACFDSPRGLRIIPLQPKLYYILLNFIKLYPARLRLIAPLKRVLCSECPVPGRTRCPSAPVSPISILANIFKAVAGRKAPISAFVNVSLDRFSTYSMFTNVSRDRHLRGSQSLPMFARTWKLPGTQYLPMFTGIGLRGILHLYRCFPAIPIPPILDLYQCFTGIETLRLSIFTNVSPARVAPVKTQLLSLFQLPAAPMPGALKPINTY